MTPSVGSSPANVLVGRDEERSRLLAALEEARAGRGRVVLIRGEAGIGKTRLLEALAEAAGLATRVLWGHCWESGGAPPYWPWVQITRSIRDATPPTVNDRLAPVWARVRQLDSSFSPPSTDHEPPSPQRSLGVRSDLFDAVSIVLQTAAREHGGMVVALEDLHAADTPSLLVLDFIARQVSASHLLVVGTYREAEMAASSERQRVLSRISPLAEPLALGGLDEDGVAALLEQTTGDVRLEFTARRVRAATDGNPFFVKHVAQFLASSGVLNRTLPVPDELEAFTHQRLEALDKRTRRILTVASVLGREFDNTALLHLSGETSSAVLDALGGAVRAGVLTECGLQQWSFSHSLLQRSLYDSMAPTERLLLHRQAGDLIERFHGHDLTPWLATLAHHFLEAASAGVGMKAVTYATRSADLAMAKLAFEEAAELYERALEVLGHSAPGDHAQRHELLMALAKARLLCGDAREAQLACRRALRDARLVRSPDRLAEAAYRLAGIDWGADVADILEEAKDALPEKDSAMRARILASLAWVRHWDRPWEWPALYELAREGVEMARRLGDAAARLDVMMVQILFSDPREIDERLALADEMIRLSRKVGSSWDLGLARSFRVRALVESGDIQAATAEVDLLSQEAEKAQSLVLRWAALRVRVSLLLLEGDIEEAEEIAHRMRSIAERWDSPDVESTFAAQLAAIRRQQGNFHDLEELARSAVNRPIGVPPSVNCVRLGLAVALARQGRTREAMGEMRDMVPDGLQPQKYGPPRTCCLMDLVELCWALEDESSAEPLYDALLPHAGLHGWENLAFTASAGATDRSLARLATLLGRWEEAETFFDNARQFHERIGAWVFRAHDDYDRARMLLTRRAVGDEARAVELLASARDRYGALGMDYYRTQAEAVLQGLGDSASAQNTAKSVIRHEKGVWSVEFAGSVVRLMDRKGARYLLALLARPGHALHVLDLVGDPDTVGQQRGAGGALAPVAAGAGEGDRRHLVLEIERARQNATKAIRATIERLGDMNAALGAHLRNSVRTGVHCTYLPDPRTPVVWDISEQAARRLRRGARPGERVEVGPATAPQKRGAVAPGAG